MADKSPYKTMHGAVRRDSGRQYFHFDEQGLLIVRGVYAFDKKELSLYREAVASVRSGSELVEICDTLKSQNVTIEPGGISPLKTSPVGYPRDHGRIGYLRLKGLFTSERHRLETRMMPEVIAHQIADFWNRTIILENWMDKNL